MIRKTLRLPGLLLKNLFLLVYAGLWFILGLSKVQEETGAHWGTYIISLLVVLPVQLPGLLFAQLRDKLLERFPRMQFLGFWAACFLVALPLMTFWSICLFDDYDASFFISAAMATIGLSFVLEANDYYLRKVRQNRWVTRIKLENALLLTIVLFAMLVAAFTVSELKDKDAGFFRFISLTAQFLVIYLCGYLIFLMNSRVLIPFVLKQKGVVLYALSAMASIALVYPVIGQLLIWLPVNQAFGRDIFPLNPFLMENAFGAMGIMLLTLPVILALQWGRQNVQIMALQQEKSQTELDLLKQQLNPHFFFNTLNNLYALSLQKSEKTSESILQLAELMRYTIYRGQEPEVTLEQEVNYLKDYIDLQQIRLKQPLQLSFEQMADDRIKIAPLLLIIFVENAFKHGIEPAESAAFLNISLEQEKDELVFSCINTVEEAAAKPHGIGLDNVKKRLDLLYPGNYRLDITSIGATFKVVLRLRFT